MLNSKLCNRTFQECLEKVKEIISSNGMEIFAVIDHAENARKVGLSLSPTTVVMFGNPRVGTLLMQNRREIGYELPLRIMVWNSDSGEVYVGYRKPSNMAKDYGIEGNEILNKMDAVMESILSKI